MGKKESSTTDNHVVVDYDNGVDQQHQRAQCDDGANTKEKEGIVLLVLSAFLFSFMGMFLQFTGRMGEGKKRTCAIALCFNGNSLLLSLRSFCLSLLLCDGQACHPRSLFSYALCFRAPSFLWECSFAEWTSHKLLKI